MNTDTEKQAQQFELVAHLYRTGHPWKPAQEKWKGASLTFLLHEGIEIRPVLVTPEDGREIHNPNNLTAEQVGIGFRLLTKDEFQSDAHTDHYEWWSITSFEWKRENNRTTRAPLSNWGTTYRVPLSTPYPNPKPADPYAELKKAHAAGKVIQISTHYVGTSVTDNEEWSDCEPQWAKSRKYRVKPEPKWGPLGPEDVPPGSVFRFKAKAHWVMCLCVSDDAVGFPEANQERSGVMKLTFRDLETTAEILRPGTTEWQPCRKEVQA